MWEVLRQLFFFFFFSLYLIPSQLTAPAPSESQSASLRGHRSQGSITGADGRISPFHCSCWESSHVTYYFPYSISNSANAERSTPDSTNNTNKPRDWLRSIRLSPKPRKYQWHYSITAGAGNNTVGYMCALLYV